MKYYTIRLSDYRTVYNITESKLLEIKKDPEFIEAIEQDELSDIYEVQDSSDFMGSIG